MGKGPMGLEKAAVQTWEIAAAHTTYRLKKKSKCLRLTPFREVGHLALRTTLKKAVML